MTQRPVSAPARKRTGTPMLHLSPLVLAILAAFPGVGGAATAPPVVRPATPLPKTVPVPAPGWLVSTSTPSLPTPTPLPMPNAAGGQSLTINQASSSAVYNWTSFDIGANSSVTFNYPSATSSSLNRVTGSTSPSAIFGSLTSQYPNPDGKGAPLIGGSIYLINANGILFGNGAQVNTGALIASTLDLQNADFYTGMSQSIASQSYTFGAFDASAAAVASLPAGANNFVLVDPGATITTASGGRVFLFANNTVQNAGTITTPNGQTALAAGDQIYLNVPTNEPMYASEVNPNVPAVNGLLVEVGNSNTTAALTNTLVLNSNTGVINTPTGNTTLVGMAVNQSGRINATTSVSQDGSVFLLARGGAQGLISSGVVVKEATVGGALTLGSPVTVNGVTVGGVVDIEPDTTVGASGQQATSSATSTFTPSLVVLDGQTIDMQANSAIIAHGGTVDARAETTPYYMSSVSEPAYNYSALVGDSARLVLDASATIDVSGTTNATVSAGRNFVTTALLGANDLADAPLQRTGPVYRSELTFDVRSPVPILGDTSAYLDAIQKTATEQLAAGGSIKLASTGAVITNATSDLNVSGGAVNYTAATVTPSELIGSNGSVYTFNQAPANQTYVAVVGAPSGQLDRWGVVPSYTPSQVSAGIVTPGYVAGQAGGTLSVLSPLTVLDGQIQAIVKQGVRQTAGQDALAAASQLVLGARSTGGNAFGTDSFVSAGLGDLTITAAQDNSPASASFWSAPLASDAVLPTTSRIAAPTLNASGLGSITVTSIGDIVLAQGANLTLPTSAVVDLAAGGANGVDLAANITAAGGSISVQTRSAQGQGISGPVTLAAGSTLDVSAAWVNRAQDGATVAAATAGGSVSLNSGGALNVQDASTINVSGGATVGVNGKVAGTAAGSIALESNMGVADTAAPAAIHVGAHLIADSLGGGGTLTLAADTITIGAGSLPSGVAPDAATGALVLSSQFFDQGAFTNYQIDAWHSLVVQAGATVQPQASNWILTPDAAQLPTGTRPVGLLSVGQLPVAQRLPVSLTLSAASAQHTAIGELTLAAGASIVTDPLASVSLTAGLNLTVAGRIVAPGGNVSLSVFNPNQFGTVSDGTSWLTLGPRADIDVSGTTLLQPQTGALPTGQVLPGGHVAISVSENGDVSEPVKIESGAVIDADGSAAMLGVTTIAATGSTNLSLQSVASAGGSIAITVASAGAAVDGNLHAVGGDATVSGGSFDINGASTVVVQQSPVTASSPMTGIVAVSAQNLAQGFSDATLQANTEIHFAADTTLAMGGNLTLDAPVLSAAPGVTSVALSGASTLSVGASVQQNVSTAGAIGGGAALSLSGGLVELFGHQVVQGFGNVKVAAASELRLENVGSNLQQGDLAVQGALTLSAPQVVPTTGSSFTFDALGQQVLITGGDSKAAVPLSAGGAITINAANITTVDPADASQGGVLRAPFGSITLNATDSINIGANSLLSVSGSGMTVPYGQTDGTSWTVDGTPVTAPPAKSIALNAQGASIAVSSGATLDLSGGGSLLAREFVPGNGGTKDIFVGAAAGAFAVVPSSSAYAAQDADILQQQKDLSGQLASVTLGRDITFGSGGGIPAGTYAVMPAEYATLPGAYLVTPVSSSAPLALGAAVKQTDGSVYVGGRFGEAGTSFGSSLTQTFKVQTSAQALAFSEIDQTNANAYFAAQATAAGTPAPSLPTDAGVLDIAASQLQLKGQTLFALPTVTTTTGSTTTTTTVGRGGELDIAASDIQVGGTAASGVLSLSAADLNATKATLIVLGGKADSSTGQVDVAANNVTIANDNTTPLTINDLVLVANNTITVQANSTIAAPALAAGSTVVAAPTLALAGDGALLRVSTDSNAASTRIGVQGAAGALDIGSNVSLSGGAITAEGTQSNVIATDAKLDAQAITLAAGHMAVGDAASGSASADTLVLTSALITQVGGAQSLTLRSATGLDLYGAVNLGSATLGSLTIDTDNINLIGDKLTSTLEAGGVTLTNGSGNTGTTTSGNNTLQLQALGTGASSGQVLIASGSVAIGGTSQTALGAAHEVVLADGANLATAGDLSVAAAALQAKSDANAALTAGGTFTLTASGTSSGNTAGSGAQVSISANVIEQQGQIVLPSGQLTLTGTAVTPPPPAAGAPAPAVHFASGSLTDVSGRDSAPIDNIVVTTPGGTLNVLAPSGNVSLDAGATLDVSGATTQVSGSATGSQGGAITISAPAGTVALLGRLDGSAAAGVAGGSLSIDSDSKIDLAALAATLAAQANNFSGSLALRNRSGNQTVDAGTALAAQAIDISADSGVVTVKGTLTASGKSDASVTLAGGAGVDIETGATIGAHSNGATGAQVQLLSGSITDTSGAVTFNGGVIDTSAASGATGATDGSLLVRAPRVNGTDIAISGVGGSNATIVRGASAIELEAVKQYDSSNSAVGTTLMSTVATDNSVLSGNASQVITRVGALLAVPTTTTMQLRSGVEIDSTGDLEVDGKASAGGWDLTQASGAPMDLTLRAAGNLDIVGSLSSGFGLVSNRIAPAGLITQAGSNITLVGGADLNAADTLATTSSATQGDVNIGTDGANVMVRSTTGDIRIAAGRDVSLANMQAVVYTTGMPVTTLPGYVGNLLGTAAYLRQGTTIQSPFLSGGGSVAVDAGRDIVGVDPQSATLQYGTEWAWRAMDQHTNPQPMWWNRYDQFQQGFATMGGGNVTASAQRDIVNGAFSAAGSGYIPRVNGSAGTAVTFQAGDVNVRAGRDLLGSFVLAGGAVGNIDAGRDIAAGDSPFALQALYGNTALSINALDNVDLGLATSFGFVYATKEYNAAPQPWLIQGLTPQATLQVQAAAGDLSCDASTPLDGAESRFTNGGSNNNIVDRIIPDVASFAAPNGSISAGTLIQDPAGTTKLSLLAQDNLKVTSITVNGTDPNSSTPTILQDSATLLLDPQANIYPGYNEFDTGTRSPMELVAQTGDITLTDRILTTTSLRMVAGRDIVMVTPPDGSGTFSGITIQHQDASEVSLIQAGRDIDFAASGGLGSQGVDLYGPGSLMVLAGRNIDLSTSGGVRADGNRQNIATNLPAASGDITVEAGVAFAAGDYTQAVAWYFPLLGGTGIAGFAPDLVAQLTALKGGQSLPALGSSAASQYAGQAIAAQVTQVKTLVGDAVFNAALLADAQRRGGSSVTLDQATKQFTSLDATAQAAVLGAALANAWVAALSPTQQQQQVLAMANTESTSFVKSLQAFMVTQGAPANIDGADALSAFEKLAPERQAFFTNQVLVSVIRTAGRTASKLSGAAQTAAYQPAYDALDTVFPGAGATGNLSMGASQIETLQDSNVAVFAPHGSVDVGTLVASGSPKPASYLGVVTADGGNLSMVVDGSVNVDQSRVFTVGLGDLLMWASNGSLDAGRGGKTVVGAPAPVYRLNPQTGTFSIDLSGSFSGSGIAVLNAASNLDLYAPKGTIDAGDAGIKSLGNAYFGAAAFVGTDNLSVAGVSVGAPPPASTGGGTAVLAAVASNAGAATTVNAGDSEEEKERKRRKRLNLVLDFLGFGDGSSKP